MRQRREYTLEEYQERHNRKLEQQKVNTRNFWIAHPDKYEEFKSKTLKEYYQKNKERLNKMTVESRRRKRELEKLNTEQEHTQALMV